MTKKYRIREGSPLDIIFSGLPFIALVIVGGLLTTLTGTM